MKGMLMAVWHFRHFILSSILNDFKLRFIRSGLGALWGVIHPLMQVLIFAFILSHVMANKLPGIDNPYSYAIYLMAGTLCWSLFAEVMQRSLTLFIDNGNLLKKIAFPRISLPVITAGGVLLSNLLLLVSVLFIFVVLGHFPSIHLLWLPLLIALTLALGLGAGLVLGVLNVFLRDIGQFVPILLQFVYWFTPVVYMATIIPEHYRQWLALNPMYTMVEAYHDVLVFGRMPDWWGLLPVALLAMVLLGLAMILFRKASPEMVDML
ncbi:MAG: ABC transporter [Thiothrix lacustris]|uniref:Transport permease protein n=1 Tax=Thiothrix lacustris TaxID=525917 RepID=A0A1Y1QE45_9GAMM|nr:MAG: ABC transporter [Thiothrix lacustris]